MNALASVLRLNRTERTADEASASRAPSFADLYQAEFGYVVRTLRRFGVRQRDLEDVCQEVFLAVHAKFADFDPKRPARPWLVAFSYRCACNYLRLARHRETPSSDAVADGAASGEPEEREIVIAALEAISFERRATLVLSDIEGMSAPEIAALTGVPLNTVYSRVRLGRAEFREAYAALGGGK